MSDEIKEAVVEEQPAAPEVAPEETMAAVLHDPEAPILTMKKCLEAGVHFGHQTRRWNPKMGKFIYGARNGIYIIDLAKTVERAITAYKALRTIVEAGGKVLFVGTKAQAQQIVIDEALRCGSFYITNRWLGGTLTNFRTIKGSIERLNSIDKMFKDGTIEALTKKETMKLAHELDKLETNLGGIKEMQQLPSVIFVIDIMKEHIAVTEARRLGIKVVAIVDTNTDPTGIDFPVPGNDDAISAIELFTSRIADAVIEGSLAAKSNNFSEKENEFTTAASDIEVAYKPHGMEMPTPEASASPDANAEAKED